MARAAIHCDGSFKASSMAGQVRCNAAPRGVKVAAVDSRPSCRRPGVQEALSTALSHSGSPALSPYGSGSLDSSFSLSRRPSLGLPYLPALSVRACAKQLNLRLMHACSPAVRAEHAS